MSILVAGQNDVKQITSTNSDTSSATPIGLDFSNIISFSVYFKHAVLVTTGYVPYAIGDNSNWPIYANLGKLVKKWTQFSIKENGKSYLVESAVCGTNYTLYLLKETEHDKNRYLGYVLKGKKKGHPFFLNTNGWTIVSIYGGRDTAAAIDERGAIHIITSSIVLSRNNETRIVFLPTMLMAISVAFQENFIVALSSYNDVYSCNAFDGEFCISNELEDYKIVKISGKNNHCIALTNDGLVFVRGKNEDGRFGTGNKQNSSVFTQIHVLKNQDIVDVDAGAFHSLFVNRAGKVYACGFDGFGEALQGDSNIGEILNPKSTNITSGARFVMAGHQNSIVFVGCNVPLNSPNKELDLVDSFPYPAMFKSNSNYSQRSQAEIQQLKTENANLKLQIIVKDATISQNGVTISQSSKSINQLNNSNKQLQSENSGLKNTNNQLKTANVKLRNTIKSQNQEIENLKKEIENLKSQINSKVDIDSKTVSKKEKNSIQYSIDDDDDDVEEENSIKNDDDDDVEEENENSIKNDDDDDVKEENENENNLKNDDDDDDDYDDNSDEFFNRNK